MYDSVLLSDIHFQVFPIVWIGWNMMENSYCFISDIQCSLPTKKQNPGAKEILLSISLIVTVLDITSHDAIIVLSCSCGFLFCANGNKFEKCFDYSNVPLYV